jgi:lipopolysaccharide transport system ATP-binding protein
MVETWPPLSVFTDLRQSAQFSDGKVRCLAVAVCDDSGAIRTGFLQGERAHFFVEFEVLQDIQVPCGGLELLTPAGLLIHSKNTFQHASPVPYQVPGGSRLRCHHCIELKVQPKEYDFATGLVETDPASYEAYVKGDMSHEEFNRRIRRHSRVFHAGSLIVGYAAGGKLNHHGIAELPGSATVEVIRDGGEAAQTVAEVASDPMPPVFHVTHWKAGSQWIYGILRQCVPDRIVEPKLAEAHVRFSAIRRGRVYPTTYMTKEELFRVAPPDSKCFVVIRDLRDTLVSAYFSFKHSHSTTDDEAVALRAKLGAMDQESGLLFLMDYFLPVCAKIQVSWLEAGEPVLKYEELLEDDLGLLDRVLIRECGLPVRPEELRKAVLDSRFEFVTQGRQRGCEQVLAHERKGVAGDWRNHFNERIKAAFKARFGGTLVAAGYEKDLRW